jgi:hypothetical protein
VPKPIYCDEGDGQPAAVIVQNLDTGDIAYICAEHWPAWILTLAEALVPGPAEVPAAEVVAAAEAAPEGEAAPHTANAKRGRQGRQRAPQALDSEASPFPDAAPVDG